MQEEINILKEHIARLEKVIEYLIEFSKCNTDKIAEYCVNDTYYPRKSVLDIIRTKIDEEEQRRDDEIRRDALLQAGLHM